MKKLLISLALIGGVGAAVVAATGAFFQDTETSTGNTVTAGQLDLYVNGQASFSGQLVNLTDVKPGKVFDPVLKVLKIVNNPGNVWQHIKNVKCTDGTPTDPDFPQGVCQLDQDIFYDLTVNQTPLILFDDNNHHTLKDVTSCWIPLGQLVANTDTNVLQSFHMDEKAGNGDQGDSLTFDETFLARQINDNTALPDDGGTITGVWDNNLKKCVQP